MCILAGLLYGYVIIPLGFRLPCPLRAVTGLKCPGCGITDMCLALLHGRFNEIPAHNYGLFILSPLLALLALRPAPPRFKRAWDRLTCTLLLLLLIWGVVRNLIGL